MAPESIIEKVQKLLALQKGAEEIGSLAEAANAAEKVQTLLLKYNLEMDDISRHDPGKDQKMGRAKYEGVIAKKNEGQWIYRLYSVLADHNFCDIVFTNYRMDNGKKNKYVNLIGTKDNVLVVKFLADQLELRLRSLEVKAWNKEGRFTHEKRNSFRRGYLIGACQGIDSQLSEVKRRAMRESEQVHGLVIANEAKLKEALTELFPLLKNGRRTKSPSAQIAGSMGYRDGRSIQINKGMGSGNNGIASIKG